ncbi:hypothetical protein CXB51_028922 [Gossypium anomalum]|uniref:Aminotransferase-like plant mobile domain-containing protein n=1 Tax=Gossypium anomalum TaxID=47600 RepID=A0A8J6CQQ6_9ROSI|nr:hypothetical protein CXB51_028922 [Gossypium anomalum]
MADNRVLEVFIHNTREPPIPEILERWRPKTHIFYLLCGECTITVEDVALQAGLPVDGSVITGSAVVREKMDLCTAMLGKVSNKFKGGRISINWLEKIFNKFPNDATEEKFGARKVVSTSSGLHWMCKTKLGIYCVVYVIPGALSGNTTGKDADWWLPIFVVVIGLVANTVSKS